jgi:hypothetical protein
MVVLEEAAVAVIVAAAAVTVTAAVVAVITAAEAAVITAAADIMAGRRILRLSRLTILADHHNLFLGTSPRWAKTRRECLVR